MRRDRRRWRIRWRKQAGHLAKRLGFHPDELPDVDVLNESSGGFNHCSFVLLWNSLYSNSLFMYSF